MSPQLISGVSGLKPIVRWSNGVAVRYGETRLLFDPVESEPMFSDIFITHAHFDHARGFEFPAQKKYSTRETLELYEVDRNRKVGNWREVRCGRRLKFGEVEVEAHDAGHVLGSVQYEIITPVENVVYASHINFTDTLLTKAAEVAPCDLLVVETTLASPSRVLPPRESVSSEIVKWTLGRIKDRRVPTLETDSIGLAQELTKILNTWTQIPVLVHPRIARINKVYEENGVGLRYIDTSTEEALKMVEDCRCAVIVPRRTDTTRYGNFETAYVSVWATKFRDSERTVFTLSDQADLNQLLQYVQEARPKAVLTCHGGRSSEVFAQMVTKRFNITVKPLVTEPRRTKPVTPKLDEKRVLRFQQLLMGLMQTRDLTYDKRDLVAYGLREGFKTAEIEEALLRLTTSGALKYSNVIDGYKLS